MEYEDIKYEKSGGIAKIIINRPEKGNMFRVKTVEEMIDAFSDVRKDKTVRAAVLRGAGDKFFCIGGEKAEKIGYHYGATMPIVDLHELIDKIQKPVIAAVNGYAVGGGNVLQAICDLSIASDKAIFRQVGPAMGSYDAGFGIWYLEQVVGRKKAKEMWMLNRKYSAQEAFTMGLVNDVVPYKKLDERVNEWCGELIKRGPQALAAIKTSFFAMHNGVAGMARMSHDMLLQYYLDTKESKELRRAFEKKEKADKKKFYR
ncbi:MAG: enoyl-CoA hydratase/isomerase family protein [Candidatus Schekmanbacteria bacterium]|nr:enoyl-CoA hydratase/isomerase family protein [Candidatus Schekmanbacteria bacterium]